MNSALTQRLRVPGWYAWACVIASITGWAPMLVLPSMIHGGTYSGDVFAFSGVVIGGYCTLEVARTRSHTWAKALWSIWLTPYAAAVIYGLIDAVLYVPCLFSV